MNQPPFIAEVNDLLNAVQDHKKEGKEWSNIEFMIHKAEMAKTYEDLTFYVNLLKAKLLSFNRVNLKII